MLEAIASRLEAIAIRFLLQIGYMLSRERVCLGEQTLQIPGKDSNNCSET